MTDLGLMLSDLTIFDIDLVSHRIQSSIRGIENLVCCDMAWQRIRKQNIQEHRKGCA